MIPAADWIAFHAFRTPDRLALIDQTTNRRFTYGELNDRSGRLATYLRNVWKVNPGDRVAILGKNSTEYFEFQFACWKLGAMMLPLNWRLAEPELLYILNDAEPKALLYDDEFGERIPPLIAGAGIKYGLRIDFGAQMRAQTAKAEKGSTGPGMQTWKQGTVKAGEHLLYEDAATVLSADVEMSPRFNHDTPAAIMYTAGTTGRPKGAVITHGMILWNVMNTSIAAGLSGDSVQYGVLPTFHTDGLNLYANPILYWGGVAVVARDFDAGKTLATLARHNPPITHFFGAPAIYQAMSQHAGFAQVDLKKVRSWGSSGAPLPTRVSEQYRERGVIIQPGFGMTETGPIVFFSDKRRAVEKPASVGTAVPHTRVRIVNDKFKDVPAGEIGELVIGGPNVTPGYWKRPDAEAESFAFDADGVRWLRSGDAAKMDEEGCAYIVDRYKDMYRSGGENVYPAEVEQVIAQMPQVAEAAVIGVPDKKQGEVGLAVVVVKTGEVLFDEALVEYCEVNLTKRKAPKSVVFVDRLPRNAAGQVLKRELKEKYGAGR
ncbi:MAG: long-chain fatty acid--CoA ligase [Anaerolineae bacterium]|nr:long-chain fatty acid--CoA ligase [Anaerolineae bacterium]